MASSEAPPEGLDEFLHSLEEYVPTIPDELTNHYLARSGYRCTDVRVTRLISLAAQKFITQVADEAMKNAVARSQSLSKELGNKGPKEQRKLVLSSEDLALALKEYGVNMRKPEYYVEDVSNLTDLPEDTEGPGGASAAAPGTTPAPQ
mmetsp:Transcript_3328/g.12048  ORF Transcript_3328/g.12048 Transcript_3328/m.12048 type:complete len:148 (+) Transcript_3328:20-463(+)